MVTIYHNPRCAKSRATLKLIKARGIEPRIVEYLKTPPSQSELEGLLKLLGLRARDLLRKKEAQYKKLKLNDPEKTEAQIVRAMVEHPILIERPIVVANGKAVLGRPPENVLKIL